MELDRLLKLFDRAVAANWLDSHRSGSLIELPSEGEVLITGDIHGSTKDSAAIVKLAALDENPHRHLIIQEVTHQLEMGEDLSFRVLEKTASLKAKYPHRVHILLGNHELAEIQGREIFKGGICLNLLFDNAMERTYGKGKDSVRKMYVEFIKTMPLAAVTQKGVFIAHSTPNAQDLDMYSMNFFRRAPSPQDFEKNGLIEKLVWGRDYSQDTADLASRILGFDLFVVGHAPCARGFETPNSRHLILDCKDRHAAFLLLDLGKSYTHEDLKARAAFLYEAIERMSGGGVAEAGGVSREGVPDPA